MVINDRFYDAALGGNACIVSMYCDHCNALIMGQFGYDAVNKKIGSPVCKPRIITDRRTIEKFLKDNPNAAGVEQM